VFIIFSAFQGGVQIILMPSVACVMNCPSYSRRNFTPLIKKCYELYFGAKWVTKIKVGPLIFVV